MRLALRGSNAGADGEREREREKGRKKEVADRQGLPGPRDQSIAFEYGQRQRAMKSTDPKQADRQTGETDRQTQRRAI